MDKETANMNDAELLSEYVQRQSESAFAELAGRHVDLVYSTALRMVREAALAQDITQAVFIHLARKAPTIRDGNALPAWLYRVTHHQAANALRAECTRRRYEMEAMNMALSDSESSTAWESIAPFVDEAMEALSEDDQNAILQRFFQGRSWSEVSAALAVSQNTAQKRVSRALDKLRLHLVRRRVGASASMIGMAIAVNAVHAAPAGLASTVTVASLASGAGVAGASGLAYTVLKLITGKNAVWTGAAVLLLAAAVSVPILTSRSNTRPARIHIGNYLVTAPTGIAFVADDAAAFVMDFAGVNERPGLAAPDDSFHQVDGDVTIEWGRTGDAVVARLTSSKPTNVKLQLSRESWPGFVSRFTPADSGVTGETELKDGRKVTWRLETLPKPVGITEGEVSIAVAPDAPLWFIAGFGELPSFDKVDELLTAAKQRYLNRRPVAVGDWGDFVGPIAENLNNTRIYSSDDRVVFHTVGRRWADGKPNNAPLFGWDSFFNGLLASLDDPQTGRQTIRSILAWAAPDGFVPNFAHWDHNPGRYPNRLCNVRSQPPVGALCVWKMHQRWPDLDFLREVYPKLAQWHAWWFKARDGNHDGLLEWGSNGQGAFEANYETGWDDTPAFEGAKMAGNTLNVNAVDLNSLYTMDAEYLALIADAIGKPEEARAYRQECAAMIQRINDKLWNEELGVYCSRYWDEGGKPGAFLTRLTPMNFYPLIAGVPDSSRAGRVLKLMTNPKKFWGQWILPTLPYDDPLWSKQDYWKGKVWAPVNYLVFQGLKRYASPELQAEFARKSVDIFMRNWTAKHVCGENYLSTTGEQSSDPHYTWGALMCLIGVESIVDVGNDGQIKTGRGFMGNIELNHIPLQGQLRRITVRNGQVDIQ